MPKFVLNIPNVLTISRLFMIPLSTILILPVFGMRFSFLVIAFVSYFLAAVTDYLDGYFARKLNQVSDWGAYMDPLIDKYLVWALYLCLYFVKELAIPLWTIFIIILRDVLITELRKYSIKHDISFKTSSLAKWKTASQMFAGGGILFLLAMTHYLNTHSSNPVIPFWNYWVEHGTYIFTLPKRLTIFAALLTFLSGLDYFYLFLKQKNTR